AGVLYLGTYPASVGKVKDVRREEYLFTDLCSWPEALKSPGGPAMKRLLVAWLPLRDIPDTRQGGLFIIAQDRITAALPMAREVLADEKALGEQRAQAALILGILGTRDDVPLLRRVAESRLANELFSRFNVHLSGQLDLNALWGGYRFGMRDIPDDLKR